MLADIEVAPDCRGARVSQRAVEASGQAELAFRLGRAIYEVHHVGWPLAPAEGDLTGQDECLEARLRAAIPHHCVTRAGRLRSSGQEHDFVEIEGVKVAFPHGDVKVAADSRAEVLVRLPSGRPALSPGYFVADGTRPLEVTGDLLRVYVHLRTEDALVRAWQAVLEALEERGAGYRAKAASRSGLLPRRDALVVYLDGADSHTAALVAERTCGIADGHEISAFAERLVPGVAMAWEPHDPRPSMRGLSFGEHRARAMAEGLLAHAGAGRQDSAAAQVCRALISAGIDPARPARNLPRSVP